PYTSPNNNTSLLLFLGVFRALAIDYLWVRAIEKREEGKFFEELAILQLLTQLQPKSPTIWMDLAYNLTYNISLSFPQKEKQWPWIEKGLLLLRKAIQKNPKNPQLKQELAYYLYDRLSRNERGQRRKNPHYLTYFQKKFLQHPQLNPQHQHPYYLSLYWAQKAIQQFDHVSAIAESLLLYNTQKLVQIEKSKQQYQLILQLTTQAIQRIPTLQSNVYPLYHHLSRIFARLLLERALAYLHLGKQQHALQDLKSALHTAPDYPKVALPAKYYLKQLSKSTIKRN
ncbi:MAG: hypothetical protein D6805_00455, partial [Planctomycetota bacterium]